MTTLLDHLQSQLHRAARHSPGEDKPACILWTDPDGQWQPVVALLRNRMTELLTLGDWDAGLRRGPAFWLRLCVDGGAVYLPEGGGAAFEQTPVLYLPGIARHDLRSGEECRDLWKPLIALQYRGTVWTQVNAKDWTVEAFLVAKDGGIGLEVARDERTRQALLISLAALAETPVKRLQNKKLEAEDFDRLMVEDTPRDLLLWMSDPAGTRSRWDESRWKAFVSRCQADYAFHPDKDGELAAGEKLGRGKGPWKALWERFCEAPSLYAGLPDLMRRAQPMELALDAAPWPKENDKAEAAVREALLKTLQQSASAARELVKILDKEHAARRVTPWAKLGLSSLAHALEPLARLATETATSLGGPTPETMAARYMETAWQADDAALRALACVKSAADGKAVETVLHAIYRPWLEEATKHFQALLTTRTWPPAQPAVTAHPGECLLFADGLRYDVGQRFADFAEAAGITVTRNSRWAALPTVTATAKPYVMPVSGKVRGGKLNPDYQPEITATGKVANAHTLRSLCEADGYQVLLNGTCGAGDLRHAKGWAEWGEIDHHGHAHGAKLANHIDGQLADLMERVQCLLDAGWRTVRVVTDHGWLLLPGGLPKAELPKFLTDQRWSRCGALKGTATAAGHAVISGWTWNPQEVWASAPGISGFMKNCEYAHGGISLQECLTPDFTLSRGSTGDGLQPIIVEAEWKGLRCRVLVENAAAGMSVDIRTKPADASTSLLPEVRALAEDGKAGLMIPDEDAEGSSAQLVVLDAAGKVLTKRLVMIGEN